LENGNTSAGGISAGVELDGNGDQKAQESKHDAIALASALLMQSTLPRKVGQKFCFE
jgi:hypothetical protein